MSDTFFDDGADSDDTSPQPKKPNYSLPNNAQQSLSTRRSRTNSTKSPSTNKSGAKTSPNIDENNTNPSKQTPLFNDNASDGDFDNDDDQSPFLPMDATRHDVVKLIKKRSKFQSSSNTLQEIPRKQLSYLTIAAICAAINHHSYLFISVIVLALYSAHVHPLWTLGAILHALIVGSICTITLAMLENPGLSRPERLRRQLGHTLMLSHFGGVGSIGEVVRLFYNVEGCTVENVKRSLKYQFGLIFPIKIITLVGMYQDIAARLNEMVKIAKITKIDNSSPLDLPNSLPLLDSISPIISNNITISQLDIMLYTGYTVFIVLCLSFLLPVIAYIFTLALEDVNDDDDILPNY